MLYTQVTGAGLEKLSGESTIFMNTQDTHTHTHTHTYTYTHTHTDTHIDGKGWEGIVRDGHRTSNPFREGVDVISQCFNSDRILLSSRP